MEDTNAAVWRKEEEYTDRDKSYCKILWINQIFAPVSFLNCQTLEMKKSTGG